MKNHLLLPLLLLFTRVLFAQNPPCQASVWPTGWANGNTTLSALDSSGASVSGYLWSNGETTSEINVSAPGNYCVTITYSDGCSASDCYDLNDSCQLLTWWNWLNNTEFILTAASFPAYMGTSYLWSTGDTTQEVVLSTPGTYCVTVTKANGCTAVSCLDAGQQLCNLYTYQVPDSTGSGNVWLNAYLYTIGSVSYQWSTGDTSSSIVVNQPGTYCVTATNGGGCTETACITVTCSVNAMLVSGGQLVAVPVMGTPPYSYLWSNGATSASTFAGQNGFYCVTVTDATGCTSFDCVNYYGNNCSAYIDYNVDNTLTANSSGTAPFTYSWNPGGYTTQTISPVSSDYYFVTVTDANGCESWTLQYWYSADSCTVDIYFYQDSFSTPGTIPMTAQSAGSWNDWQYEWSNGITGAYAEAVTAGEYCVTATNQLSGCTAVNCMWVQPDSSCYVQIDGLSIDPLTWQLTATGGPDPVAAYAWSTGATTPSINVSGAGHYSVTVTNTAGCTVSNYYQLYPNQQFIVQVEFADTVPVGNNGIYADIYLIQYDTAQGGILTAIDTVATYAWSSHSALVQLNNVPAGQYLVKAALKPGSAGYYSHLPTYYDQAVVWNNATLLTVNAATDCPYCNDITIHLVPGQFPGGAGFIGGLVSQGANFTGSGEEDDDRGDGDPFEGAWVVISLPDGTPLASAATNAAGQYEFDGLAWGTYILTLDIPGLEPVSITVTIGPGQPAVGNIDFKVDENSIALPVKNIENEPVIKAFPNPAGNTLYLETPSDAHLTMVNSQGQRVLEATTKGPQATLSLQGIPSGVYFLTVRTGSGINTIKVVKE
ncbi:MAG: T9SS type A sorting domain-containing protein [Saprospiraceae bacterium]|nr:T9SS type A sorting domain-containing protein [Saprospiraceae bacterium]